MKMAFETYLHLTGLLEAELKRIHTEYITARFMLSDNPKNDHSKNELWETYLDRHRHFSDMSDQLRYAAGLSQGPDASDETKQFWGLK